MDSDDRSESGLTLTSIRADLERALHRVDALQRKLSADAAGENGDHLQVDVGTYQIFQGDANGPLIAELFVERDRNDPTNEKISIEHWGLYPQKGWITPSSTSTRPPALAFRYVVGGYGSADDFRAWLRGQPGVIYIQARCVTQNP